MKTQMIVYIAYISLVTFLKMVVVTRENSVLKNVLKKDLIMKVHVKIIIFLEMLQ